MKDSIGQDIARGDIIFADRTHPFSVHIIVALGNPVLDRAPSYLEANIYPSFVKCIAPKFDLRKDAKHPITVASKTIKIRYTAGFFKGTEEQLALGLFAPPNVKLDYPPTITRVPLQGVYQLQRTNALNLTRGLTKDIIPSWTKDIIAGSKPKILPAWIEKIKTTDLYAEIVTTQK